MSSKGLTKSPATAKFKSSVLLKKITDGPKTIGVRLDRSELAKLAHLLLGALLDERCEGDTVLTAHRDSNRFTVLTNIKAIKTKRGK